MLLKSLKNAVDNSDVKSVMENLTKVLNEDEIKNLVSKIENFEGSLTDSAANKTEILNAIKGAKEAINQSTEESIQKVSTELAQQIKELNRGDSSSSTSPPVTIDNVDVDYTNDNATATSVGLQQ